MPEGFVARWTGVIITAVIVVAVGVLAATGQLAVYIHPRYFVFTIVLCAVAAIGCVLALLLPPRGDHDDHDDHDHGGPRPGRVRAGLRIAAAVAIIAGATVVLVLPARALSAETAATRSSDTVAAAAARPVDLTALTAADYSGFGLKDWSGLLAQGASAAFLAGKTADLQGFVMPDPQSAGDVFLLTRLTITCCAIDAQPVTVPVHLAGWASRFAQGDWVSVQGGFIANPDTASSETVVLDPRTIAAISEPAQPYAY